MSSIRWKCFFTSIVSPHTALVQARLWEDQGQESRCTRHAGDYVRPQHAVDDQRGQLQEAPAPVDLLAWHAGVRSGTEGQRAAQRCECLSRSWSSPYRTVQIPSLPCQVTYSWWDISPHRCCGLSFCGDFAFVILCLPRSSTKTTWTGWEVLAATPGTLLRSYAANSPTSCRARWEPLLALLPTSVLIHVSHFLHPPSSFSASSRRPFQSQMSLIRQNRYGDDACMFLSRPPEQIQSQGYWELQGLLCCHGDPGLWELDRKSVV